jgi:hypothetical protein
VSTPVGMPITWESVRQGESYGDAREGDAVGLIEIMFTNATSTRGGQRRTRPDLVSARRLAAHFNPYNNTRIEAWQIVRTDGVKTVSRAVDLRVDDRFVFCRCFQDDEQRCTRVDELAALIRDR